MAHCIFCDNDYADLALHNANTHPSAAKPKQSTRLRKVLCEVDGYIARISRSTLITHGSPICPTCNQAMKEVK